MKKQILIGSVVLAILITVGLLFTNKNSYMPQDPATVTQVVSQDEPVDIVLDFYSKWLAALQSSSTDPYQSDIVHEPLLSQALREKLQRSSMAAGGKDAVICQNPIPEKVQAKILYERPGDVQIIVFSKEQRLAGQAVVTTRRLGEGWYIDSLECSKEFDEPGEFSFEHEGNLLKAVPPPYDSNVWHFVYAQNGVNGYVVPLFFGNESLCIDLAGNEATCDENNFTNADKVTIRGDMTEAGLTVKRVEYSQ
jgi:hypothetical protein